jgi:hypothetical protein
MADHNTVATANSQFSIKVLRMARSSSALFQCQTLFAALLMLADNDCQKPGDGELAKSS